MNAGRTSLEGTGDDGEEALHISLGDQVRGRDTRPRKVGGLGSRDWLAGEASALLLPVARGESLQSQGEMMMGQEERPDAGKVTASGVPRCQGEGSSRQPLTRARQGEVLPKGHRL